MICIISPTHRQADGWAHMQNLSSHEWFYAADKTDVMRRNNYHVIVIGEFPEERLAWFENIYRLAKMFGAKLT